MSLDIDLIGPARVEPCTCECGHVHEKTVRDTLWSGNITHNCNVMAAEAGIYAAVWRPDENGITTARQMIPILERGLVELRAVPAKYRALEAENGWGKYDEWFLPFIEAYFKACGEHPDAEIEVSR